MPSGFFEAFPLITYNNKKAKNLLVSTKIRDTVLNNPKAFLMYTVSEWETPETVALKFYGDIRYSWIIHMVNLHVDPYHDWPMPYLDFIKYIKNKYGSVPAAKANIVEYVHDDYSFSINQATYERYSNADFIDSTIDVDRDGWTAVDSYTKEDEKNNERRNINILMPEFIPIIEDELKDIFK